MGGQLAPGGWRALPILAYFMWCADLPAKAHARASRLAQARALTTGQDVLKQSAHVLRGVLISLPDLRRGPKSPRMWSDNAPKRTENKQGGEAEGWGQLLRCGYGCWPHHACPMAASRESKKEAGETSNQCSTRCLARQRAKT